jgi:hypothetical protein
MGKLYYGAARFEVEFDDRVLAHLQLVMTGKLRRSEAFLLSWATSSDRGSGRSMIWIHPTTDLHFQFAGNGRPSVNREWLERLAVLANTATGLYVTPEGDLRATDTDSDSGAARLN